MTLLNESLEKKILFNPGFLLESYLEPHRHYHTLSHIKDILDGIDLAVDYYKLSEYDESILHTIAWFHDVIYDPKAPLARNEVNSAELFSSSYEDGRLGGLDYISSYIINMIHGIIVGTNNHKMYSDEMRIAGSSTFLAGIFFDLDLRGLGTDSYLANAVAVRKEFSHLSDEEWQVGRIKFLESMLDRNIFYTSLFGPLESRAKENLSEEYFSLYRKRGSL